MATRNHRTCLKLLWIMMASVALAGLPVGITSGATPAELELESGFQSEVQPFMESYCLDCHTGEKAKADLNLDIYNQLSEVVRDYEYWQLVLERLHTGEMPPKKAKHHPTPEARQRVIAWIEALHQHEAEKNAGDPGPVLARRLSNAEYDYTIRDLTGVDIRPTREFPVDPANQAGFDNSGESLAMSPALFKKYLQAAQQVAAHMALTPDGFAFAPHPMLVETDRDKYCVHRIVEFYRRQPTDYADYFEVAWRFHHRSALGRPEATLPELAAEARISVRYVETIWATLQDPSESVGPIAVLQSMWRDLPAPEDHHQPATVRSGCVRLRDHVTQLRAKLEWDFQNLSLRGFSSGGQAFIGWKNRQFATHRMTLNPEVLQIEGQPKFERSHRPINSVNGSSRRDSDNDQRLVEVEPDPDLTIPVDEIRRAEYVAAFTRFCRVFPDTFYRAERGRMHFDKVKEKEDKGRYLSAGFHNMMGYFRDDTPLCELILEESGRRELDRLWTEFDFIARVPERQHAEFIFYERAETSTMRGPEFDFARSEDKSITSADMMARLRKVYLEKAQNSVRDTGSDPMLLEVIDDHFRITDANIRRIETIRSESHPRHLEALTLFAERAYRRPLADAERESLLTFYHSLCEEGLSHEEAIRDAVASVLVSPNFCYRIDLVEASGLETTPRETKEERSAQERSGNISDAGRSTGSATAPSIHPQARLLSQYALASRLSYFLWSSMPDAELLAQAAAGDLHEPSVLAAQARRMLRDDRVRGLATEFGGQWLDFRRFEEHNAVDRERFPAFNDTLRQAMFEEPIRFFLHVAQNHRSVLDFLYANDTFVNPVLAQHYGMASVGKTAPGEWAHVPDADQFGRGGLLPMAVFLTQNAPGLRTSPVKRGYWVARRVLGERIPPPPPLVPDLPRDESKMELSLRDTLAQHRADPNCAACHERFDALGLVFEGYGPVGERRQDDLGGRPVDTRATFPDGTDGGGLDGLRHYLREQREDDFVDNLCRKLFAFALGRTLILSDDAAIKSMRSNLTATGYQFDSLIESIVTSPQFRTKRAPEELAQN